MHGSIAGSNNQSLIDPHPGATVIAGTRILKAPSNFSQTVDATFGSGSVEPE